MSQQPTDMQRHEIPEVSEDADRATEPINDLAAKFEETAYQKHLWLVLQNTNLRGKIRKSEEQLSEALKDTARLDWLATSTVDSLLRDLPRIDPFKSDPEEWLRAAIDAAREAAK